MKKIARFTLVCIIFILSGCSVIPKSAETTVNVIPQDTQTSTESLKPSPTITITPTLEPTTAPLPIFPYKEETPVPDNGDEITSKNITQMIELAHWGKASISDLKYSPDGKYIAAATSEGVRLYDVTTLNDSLEISNLATYQIEFGDNGTKLILLHPGLLEVWNINPKLMLAKKIELENNGFNKYSLYSSSAGNVIVLSYYNKTEVYNTNLLKLFEVDYANNEPDVLEVAVSADGKLIAMWKRDGFIYTYDVETKNVIGRNQANKYDWVNIYSMAFTSGNQNILATSDFGFIYYKINHTDFYYLNKEYPWFDKSDLGTGEIQSSVDGNIIYISSYSKDKIGIFDFVNQKSVIYLNPIQGANIDISPDGLYAAIASNDLEIRSIQDDKTISKIEDQFSINLGWRNSIQWGNSTFAYNNSDSGKIYLLSAQTGVPIKVFEGEAFALRNENIVISDNHQLCNEDLSGETEKVCISFEDGLSTGSLKYSQDGNMILFDGCTWTGCKAVLYSSNSLELIHQFDLGKPAGTSPLTTLFGPEEEFFLASKGGVLNKWNTDKGKIPKGYNESVYGPLIKSRDGTKLIFHGILEMEKESYFTECKLDQKELKCERKIKTVPVFINYSMTPDGSILASYNLWTKDVELWDIQTGSIVRKINLKNDCLGISFSPDGKKMLIASDNGFHLWGIKP